MNCFKKFCLIFFIFSFSSHLRAKDCFIVSENNQIIYKEGDCDGRYSPCSTFKIAISLMGFDTGILIDETNPMWDFDPSYVDWLDRWKQPHGPKLWFSNSCVWYSQLITRKLGMKRFKRYTKCFNYGNQNTSGDSGMNNGLTNCWLSSSLSISPKEQIDFLNKLIANKLPVSINGQSKTKNLMYQEVLPSGWDLYGKTGSGLQVDADGRKIKDRQVGWFIGFVCKDKRIITFAYLIVDEDKKDTYASLRAKASLKDRIGSILGAFDQKEDHYN